MPTRNRSEIHSDETLHAGEALWSPDGRFTAILQSDGNFCCYGYARGENGIAAQVCHWSSDRYFANGAENSRLVFGAGGVPLILDNAGTVIWRLGSSSHLLGGDRLVIQNDNNFVLYAGNRAVWAHGRTCSIDDPTWISPNRTTLKLPSAPPPSILSGTLVIQNPTDEPYPILSGDRYKYVAPGAYESFPIAAGHLALEYTSWNYPPSEDRVLIPGGRIIVIEPGQTKIVSNVSPSLGLSDV